jgi:hypothetical protein
VNDLLADELPNLIMTHHTLPNRDQPQRANPYLPAHAYIETRRDPSRHLRHTCRERDIPHLESIVTRLTCRGPDRPRQYRIVT